MPYDALTYDALCKRVREIEEATGAYLLDVNVDIENCELKESDENYWAELTRFTHSSVGMRMCEAGLNPSDYGILY